MGRGAVGQGSAGIGGGNDGGTVAAIRSIIVKTKEIDRHSVDRLKQVQAERWQTCALSGNPLQVPIVADELGSLFNKDAVLEFLLEKRDVPQFSHIKSLKRDVLELKVQATADGSSSNGASTAGGSSGSSSGLQQAVRIVCPVTMLEANGSHPFCAMRKCGCVVSERAVRELASSLMRCPACEAPFASNGDILKLVPTEEETVVIRQRLVEAKKQQQLAKKDKAAGAAKKEADGDGGKTKVEGAEAVDLKRPRPADGPRDESSREDAAGAGSSSSAASSSSGAGGEPKRRKLAHEDEAAPQRHSASMPQYHHAQQGTRSDLASLAAVEAARSIEEQKKRSTVYAALFGSSSSSGPSSAAGAGAGAPPKRTGAW